MEMEIFFTTLLQYFQSPNWHLAFHQNLLFIIWRAPLSVIFCLGITDSEDGGGCQSDFFIQICCTCNKYYVSPENLMNPRGGFEIILQQSGKRDQTWVDACLWAPSRHLPQHSYETLATTLPRDTRLSWVVTGMLKMLSRVRRNLSEKSGSWVAPMRQLPQH